MFTVPFFLLWGACQVNVSVPDGQIDALAEDVCTIGHPLAKYQGASVVGGAVGCLNQSRHIDLAIRYRGALASQDQTMTVRFYVESLEPCSVRSDVISDTGSIPPVLLDNALVSPAVGQMVCDALLE